MIRNALIAGATGMTGHELLKLLVREEYYNSVHVLSRRSYPWEHQKIQPYEVDFGRLEAFQPSALIHHVYICLGTTIRKAGSRENFRKVDHDYVLNLAQWALNNRVEKLAVISSMGAKPGSRNFYLRTKGEMEEDLKALGLPRLLIVRPSLLLGKRDEFRLGERLATAVMRPVSSLFPIRSLTFKPIEAHDVACTLFKSLARLQEPVRIMENKELHRLNRGE